jgi:lipopolysaccharide export system protein LptC
MVEPAHTQDTGSAQSSNRYRTDWTPTPRSGEHYSRFVGAMRISLPLVALCIVVLVIAWPQFTSAPKKFSLDSGRVSVQAAVGQRMVNAHFTGADSSGNPFTVTADTAVQVKNAPDLLEMTVPKADITTRAGSWVALSAKKGLFNRNSERLDLADDVTMFHDSGYEFRTTAARIDLTTSRAEGDDRITGHGPGGTVEAEGFRILERGAVLVFSGKSKMEFYPKTQKRKAGSRR